MLLFTMEKLNRLLNGENSIIALCVFKLCVWTLSGVFVTFVHSPKRIGRKRERERFIEKWKGVSLYLIICYFDWCSNCVWECVSCAEWKQNDRNTMFETMSEHRKRMYPYRTKNSEIWAIKIVFMCIVGLFSGTKTELTATRYI